MRIYDRLMELEPAFEGYSIDELARDRMVCPAEFAAELVGDENAVCQAEAPTPGQCRECQMRFLRAVLPAERIAGRRRR